MKNITLLLVFSYTAISVSAYGMDQADASKHAQQLSSVSCSVQSLQEQEDLDRKLHHEINARHWILSYDKSESPKKNVSYIESLITNRASVNSFINGSTPLLTAIKKADAPLVDLLLKHGAWRSVNTLDTLDRSPLSWATQSGVLHIAQALINNGAASSINVRNKKEEGLLRLSSNRTSLYYAVKQNHTEMVRLLLMHGAARSIDDDGENRLLFWATTCHHNREILKRLLVYSAKPIGDGQLQVTQACDGLNEKYKSEINRATALRRAALGQHISPLPLVIIIQEYLSPLTFRDIVVARKKAAAHQRVEKIQERLYVQNLHGGIL